MESDSRRGPFYLFPSLPVSWQLPPGEGPPGTLPCVFCEISSFPFFPFRLVFFPSFFRNWREGLSRVHPYTCFKGSSVEGCSLPTPFNPRPPSPAQRTHCILEAFRRPQAPPPQEQRNLKGHGPSPSPPFLCHLSLLPVCLPIFLSTWGEGNDTTPTSLTSQLSLPSPCPDIPPSFFPWLLAICPLTFGARGKY